ncbi:septum formation initiator [Enterobacter hormaechei]|uniref:septum formation initiator n=1 Tax=Enterobacter hormaechei TaxID=158836 RepID=UPI0039BF64E4
MINESSCPKLQQEDINKWNAGDSTWMLCLFGTAIGAGVLFLPINAGIGGVIPLIVVMVLAFPITFFAHRALARFILSSPNPENGIGGAILHHFGTRASTVFNIIYFLAIYTILLMYAVAVTNTAESFILNQLKLPQPNRMLLSLALISVLLLIVRAGQDITVKIMSLMVYPFILSLVIMSFWLIPQWNGALFEPVSSFSSGGTGIVMTLWMVFPVLVLSFNHYPIVSPFVVAQRARYGEKYADRKCGQIQRYGCILMVGVVLFFVCSCALSLSPQDLASAKQQNITVLSYLANHFNTPAIAWMAPVIAFIAIIKSFLGHYIGAHETARDMLFRTFRNTGNKTADRIILIFMVLTCWYTACENPSILGIIESISGPTGAVILLLLPMYAIYKIPSLRQYRGRVSNYFIILTGIVTVSAIFFNVVN